MDSTLRSLAAKLLAAAIALLAMAVAAPMGAPAEEPNTLRGVVLRPDGGPAADSQVRITGREPSGSLFLRTTRTDGSGRFAQELPPAMRVFVEVQSHDGYAPQVTASRAMMDGDVEVVVPLALGGVIEFVVDPAAKEVLGSARPRVRYSEVGLSPSIDQEARFDEATSTVRTVQVAPGSYEVARFNTSGLAMAFELPDRVEVDAGEVVRVPLPLRSIRTITGRVETEAGAPVAGASVGPLGGPVRPTETDAEGRFTLQLPVRDRPFRLTAFDSEFSRSTSEPVAIDQSEVVITLAERAAAPAWTQSLEVVDDAGLPIHRFRFMEQPRTSTSTLSTVIPLPELPRPRLAWTVVQSNDGVIARSDFPRAFSPRITRFEEVDAEGRPTGRIGEWRTVIGEDAPGRVVLSRGEPRSLKVEELVVPLDGSRQLQPVPAAGVGIILHDAFGSGIELVGVVDSSGIARFDAVPPVAFVVEPQTGYSLAWKEWGPVRFHDAEEMPSIRIAGHGALSLSLLGADGAPVAGRVVQIIPARDLDGRQPEARSTKTDADGIAYFRDLPTWGYGVELLGEDGLLDLAMRAEVRPGTVEELAVDLGQRASFHLELEVDGSTNTSYGEMRLALREEETGRIATPSAARGYYHLAEAGTYRAHFSASSNPRGSSLLVPTPLVFEAPGGSSGESHFLSVRTASVTVHPPIGFEEGRVGVFARCPETGGEIAPGRPSHIRGEATILPRFPAGEYQFRFRESPEDDAPWTHESGWVAIQPGAQHVVRIERAATSGVALAPSP